MTLQVLVVRIWLGLVLGLLVQACASYSPHQSALPTPSGMTNSALAADFIVVDRGLGPELFASPEFGVSHGVSRNLTLGGRVYPLGVEFFAKHRAIDRVSGRVSLMPLAAVSQVSATNADTSFVDVTSGCALLGGLDLTPKLTLNVGLRSQLRLGLNAVAVREDFGAARWALLSGGSLGLDWHLNRALTLNPALLVLVPYDFDREVWDFPIFQGGVALGW